jgi:hypothetical protein
MRVRKILRRLLQVTGLLKQPDSPARREGRFVDRSYSSDVGKRNYEEEQHPCCCAARAAEPQQYGHFATEAV